MIIQTIPHDPDAVAARLAVHREHLPPAEYETLRALVDRRGEIVSAPRLWALIAPGPAPYEQRRDNLFLRQRLFRLRRAMGTASEIVTVPAFGYTMTRFDGIPLAEVSGVMRPRPRVVDRYCTDLTPLAARFALAFERAKSL